MRDHQRRLLPTVVIRMMNPSLSKRGATTMKIQHQLIRNHNPDKGIYGDCQRTCIACFLDKDASEVPNFLDKDTNNNGALFTQRINEYLTIQGLAGASFYFEDTVDNVRAYMEDLNPRIYYLMYVQSPKSAHSIICRGSTLICEPANEYTWADFTPMEMDDGHEMIGVFLLIDQKFTQEIEEEKEQPAGLVGKKNIYICEACKSSFVTMDIDEGTTPFLTDCVEKNCTGLAQSSLYRVDQRLRPHFVWYKPDAAEIDRLPTHLLDHISQGGLLKRAFDA